MASAMLLDALSPELREQVTVESAGVAATDGAPATAAAIAAVAAHGVDLSAHRARHLTPAMVEEADLILTMEESHRRAVLAMVDPTAAGRRGGGAGGERGEGQEAPPDVQLLHAFETDAADPRDAIHDPFGASPEVYEECLARIRRHLERVRAYLETRFAGEHHPS